jgi:hypothetical protein
MKMPEQLFEKCTWFLMLGCIVCFNSLTSQAQSGDYFKKSQEASLTTDASAEMPMALYQVKDRLAFRLIFSNLQGGAVDICIRNNNREIIYHEHLKNGKQYYRTFDMSPVGDGIYTFELSTTRHQYIRSVQLRTQSNRQAQVLELPKAPLLPSLIQ